MSYQSEVLADTPLVYYRLGEASGTSAADSSGNGSTATHTNSPTVGVTGLLSGDADLAVQYSRAATTPHTISGNVVASSTAYGTFAIEAFIKPNTLPASVFQRIFGTTNGSVILQLLDSRVRGTFRASNGATVNFTTATGTIVAGNPYHVVFEWDGTNAIIYVNGSAKVTTAQALGLTTAIGATSWRVASSTSTEGFDGVIDECAFYDHHLGSTRVFEHWDEVARLPQFADTVGISASLVTYVNAPLFDEIMRDNPYAYYRLNETSGTQFKDSVGRFPATITGAPVLNQTSLQTEFNGGIDTDPSAYFTRSDWAQSGTAIAANVDVGTFAVEAIVKIDAGETADEVILSGLASFSFGINLNSPNYSFRTTWNFGNTNNYALDTLTAGASGIYPLAGPTVHHVIFEYDGTNAKYYVDGVLVYSAAEPNGLKTDPVASTPFYITGNGGDFKGYLDEVAFYDHHLGQTRVTAHFNALKQTNFSATLSDTVGITATLAVDSDLIFRAPVISSLSPDSGPTAGGTSIEIVGEWFNDATAVRFDGVPVAFTINSNTSITVTSPAHAVDVVDVTVANGTSISGSEPFSYVAAPILNVNSPTSGSSDGGTSVDIDGHQFTGATAVYFGTTPATSFIVNSDSSITAVTPPHPPGVVAIRVVTPSGTSS